MSVMDGDSPHEREWSDEEREKFYELDPFAIPPEVAEWIRRRTSDDPTEHTNLHPRDQEAMRWLVNQAIVLRANITAWKRAADQTIQRIIVMPSEEKQR